MVCLGLAGPGFLETMLWQGLFWQLSGGPCAPGGAFVGPINEERRMAMLELCPAWPWLLGAMVSLWSRYGLAGPGFLETMLWQGLFWQLSGGPCAPGGAFVGPINEERRMAMLELCPAWPGLLGAMVSLWSGWVWLGRASLKPCSGKVCFGSFRVALVHLEALSSDQLMKREGWLCWSSVRPGPGFLELWSRYGLAMVWLGRASLKPCSGKVCFGSFRVALVHLEALSSDQLMKREGWLCWSSVRPGPGFLEVWSRYGLAGPGFLETMLWQGLFWQLSGGPCAPGGAFVGPINEERRMAMLELCPAGCGLCFWLGVASWSYGLAMVWLGRASLKPCSGKVCFGSFRVALVHLEALSSDQLMKREGWLCWSSVRPGPGFLELWSRYGLAGFGWAGLP